LTRVVVFFGDERMVPPDDAGSNYRMAAAALLGRVPIPEGNIHRVRGEADTARAAAREYEEVLSTAFATPAAGGADRPGGVPRPGAATDARPGATADARPGTTADSPPAFDLILLGIGPDAHTASLFAESPALIERRRWAVESPGPPPYRERVTLTFPVLNAARIVLFLATGKQKAEAVRRVLKGERDPWRFPAQGVQPDPGALVFILDRDAASLL
jgi:6-phosphogluconolactonase